MNDKNDKNEQEKLQLTDTVHTYDVLIIHLGTNYDSNNPNYQIRYWLITLITTN